MTRRVLLICGPPGAGKTTEARRVAAAEGLAVYDRDDPQWAGERAFELALAGLAANRTARAVVIRSAPTRALREHFAALIGATAVHVLAVPADVCRRRLVDRGREDLPNTLAGLARWWRDAAADGLLQTTSAATPPPPLTPSRDW